MDNEQFDGMARILARKFSRRGVTVILPGIAALALTLPEVATARHKRKRKRCRYAQQTCGGRSGRCCGGLSCGNNGCAGRSVCYQNQGAGCSADCDCGGDLRCSERGDTCQYCGYPETPCTFTSECCLKDSICGYNDYQNPETVCCQWEVGSFCYDDWDCCAELGCFGSMCLPYFLEDGTRRTAGASGTAEPAGKEKWPRRGASAGTR